MTNWKKYFEDEFGARGFVGTGITKVEDVEAFIQTEVIEKLIEEIPAKFQHKECADGKCEPCDDCTFGLKLQYLKQQLRAKWLN